MLIENLVTIFQLFISIEYSYSFKRIKHTYLNHYKALDSVSIRNLTNGTWYDIYVAGETSTMYIPTSAAFMIDIFDWKVVNHRKDRLMFVYKNKPKILVDQKTIREMKSETGTNNTLTGSIIAFGDNEALHVPTIFNPNLTEPFPKWNYIELLYFDDANVKVSVKRSLPMLKDDWKFIKEWKMTDYIHFNDKLYLLIKRSIWNEKTKNVTQEISIIRLCLDRGSELISSAIEIRYNQPEFQNNQITGAIFICLTYYKPEKILLLVTKEASNKSLVHTRYFIDHFVSLFDKTGQGCASGANNYTLMRYHLRSEVRSCQKTIYKNCSSNQNIVPSVELNFDRILDYHFIFADGGSYNPQIENAYNHYFNQTHFCHNKTGSNYHCFKIYKNLTTNLIHNVESFCQGYPIFRLHLLYNSLRFNESRRCFQMNETYLTCYKYGQHSNDLKLHYYINHRPLGYFRFSKYINQFHLAPDDFCYLFKSCIHCMMYGLFMDCVWSESRCKKEEKPVTRTTADYCFKIARILPLMFNSSSPETLTIELDKPLNLDDTQEYLDIKAGPHNHCTNIKPNPNGLIFNCSMRLSESGKFKIIFSLQNDRYADAITLSALSTEKVDVVAPEDDYLPTVIVLVLGLLFISLIVYLSFKNAHSQKIRKKSQQEK
uniref:Uncharacterized protein n=1 Tax=Tetranychus urticae TaxID=32264 RepID=A0A158P4Z6_TETUR